ncbi:MAG TPA: DUF6665 family protein [Arsenicitalea sp.]|jgi:hypothetical protein|nr:DUF6665 family protein [Arsenicitalea sp.]
MSLRDSIDLIQAVKPEGGYAVLQREIVAERASSLGAAEKRVIATLTAWRQAEETAKADHLSAARYAVWAYFVQRELCGFRRHTDVINDLGIPPVVLNGLGETPRRPFR